MEPPAKRLRILQSVEVDETNPEYIEAKQKQQQKFKGRLESLFAKYEGMHESMSDEIDFTTGKVVVDRGHLRRVQRQMGRKESTLLDNFLEAGQDQHEASEKEEQGPESDDELAPTQVPQRKRTSMGDQKPAHHSQQYGATSTTSPAYIAPAGLMQGSVSQVPNTPNPAASLLHQVQFPQTPLGQQAQAAFYANLNQTIAQAVQQAVAPLLSTVFQTTPSAHAAQTPVYPMPLSVRPASDNVRPAADPKWYFPPISITKDAPQTEHEKSSPPVMKKVAESYSAHKTPTHRPVNRITRSDAASSPLVLRRRSPKVQIQRTIRTPNITKQTSARNDVAPLQQVIERPQTQPASQERPQSSHSLPGLLNDTTTSDLSVADSPSSKVKGGKSTRKRYCFTEEDDVYISKSRELHNRSFREIKASKEKWSDWPVSAFYNRWSNHLKDKQLHLQHVSKTVPTIQPSSSTPPEQDEQFFSSIEIPETSSASHRLPTPSSLGQDDSHTERVPIPSSSHFDDDELELLSLAGADVSQELPTFNYDNDYDDDDDDDEAAYPTPDEILPSIEGAEFRNEDELQLEMLKTEKSDSEESLQPKLLPSTIPETQDSVVAVSSPTQKRKTNPKPNPNPAPTHRTTSDSPDNLNLIATASPTPRIKRESLTPPASKFLCSSPAFKTPRTVPHSSGILSTSAKSTGKMDRRAYLKEVKQSWARNRGKTMGSWKRRSLNTMPVERNTLPVERKRKRAWAEVEGDSEDELAA